MKHLWNKIHSDNRLIAVFYGTISSIIGSLIINYSSTILSWLGKYTFGALTKFIDSRYAKAATLEPTDYSYFLLLLIFVVIVIAWIEITSAVKKKLSNTPESETKQTPEGETNSPSWVVPAFVVLRIFVWFYLGWGLLYVAGESTVLNSVTDFKQHIRILSPYIEPTEKDLLISEWSQMRSAEDYDNIYGKLGSLAEKNNLTLYRNRQY